MAPDFKQLEDLAMNIKILAIALILISVTYGCTNTVQVTQTTPDTETVQGTEIAQETETVEGADLDPDDPDAITCKLIAKTGSRVKTKICGTNRQWALSEEESQQNTKDMQNRVQYKNDSG